ncbi:MAG: VCBS repeat-containing protein, partial [Planctomycetes bacterium]|nr:VCBS repeat-containing protein [Planctomycetota bacterium]
MRPICSSHCSWHLVLPLAIATACGGSPTTTGHRPGGIESTPLRPPAAAATGPRFVRVPASESGLEFTNVLRRENTVQYLTNGAGLATGDYDGDGLVDVYLVCQDGPNKLFRQTAPLRFTDVTQAAGNL